VVKNLLPYLVVDDCSLLGLIRPALHFEILSLPIVFAVIRRIARYIIHIVNFRHLNISQRFRRSSLYSKPQPISGNTSEFLASGGQHHNCVLRPSSSSVFEHLLHVYHETHHDFFLTVIVIKTCCVTTNSINL